MPVDPADRYDRHAGEFDEVTTLESLPEAGRRILCDYLKINTMAQTLKKIAIRVRAVGRRLVTDARASIDVPVNVSDFHQYFYLSPHTLHPRLRAARANTATSPLITCQTSRHRCCPTTNSRATDSAPR
jgi:hypothetical protein